MRAPVIGVVVAGVASFLVWSYMKRFEEEASGGAKVQVLTVVKTLEPGAVIKDTDIGERGIPQAYVDSRAIRATERQRIANLHVSTTIDAQQVLSWSDIVSTNDERLMSTLVQPNMRAVSISTERGSTMVRPGDRVDVIATLPQPGNNDHRAGVVLLQNVLVLGHPPTTSFGGDHGATTTTVLSLSLHDSQLLAVAGDKAKLSLALRSAEDVRVLESPGEISSTSLVEQQQKAAAAKPKTGPVALGGK